MVDGRIHGKMTPASMLEMLNKIKKSEETNTEAQPALCGCPEPKEVLK
jgi:hypothetical protein